MRLTPLLVALLAWIAPGAASGAAPMQLSRSIRPPPVRRLGLAERCGTDLFPRDPLVARVSETLSFPSAAAFSALDGLEAQARAAVADSPGDVEAQYALAVVMGARTDLAEGRDRLSLADALLRQVERVLALDPSHPGAHHILGRLEAAVMRMGGLERFLARHVLGGEVVAEASWDGARAHLEAAEEGAPCIPEHHYELARLLHERERPALALREVGHVLELTAADTARWASLRRRATGLLEGG